MSGVFARGADQAGFLLASDSAIRRPVLFRLPGFHLDEDKGIPLPANEIHFTVARSHAVVPRDDDNAGALQVAMRNVLAAAPGGEVWRKMPLPAVMPEHIGEFVQVSHHSEDPNRRNRY